MIYSLVSAPSLECRGLLCFIVAAKTERFLDEAVLRLNLKDCNVLSLPQDHVNRLLWKHL